VVDAPLLYFPVLGGGSLAPGTQVPSLSQGAARKLQGRIEIRDELQRHSETVRDLFFRLRNGLHKPADACKSQVHLDFGQVVRGQWGALPGPRVVAEDSTDSHWSRANQLVVSCGAV
jgi:hypothetical protein